MNEILTQSATEQIDPLASFQIDFEPLNEQDPAAGEPLHYDEADLGHAVLTKASVTIAA